MEKARCYCLCAKGRMTLIKNTNPWLYGIQLACQQLCKFYNCANISWPQLVRHAYYQNFVPHGSFWWRDICSFAWHFRAITALDPRTGMTILPCEDKWHSGASPPEIFIIFCWAQYIPCPGCSNKRYNNFVHSAPVWARVWGALGCLCPFRWLFRMVCQILGRAV